jgi:hypothetical protein
MLDIETRLRAIREAKGINQATHVWLEGISDIIGDKVLEIEKLNEYFGQRLSQFPDFTKFSSGNQAMALIKAYREGFDFRTQVPVSENIKIPRAQDISEFLETISREDRFIYCHTPISKDYHFQFPLFKQDPFYTFVFTKCERCGNKPHGLPEINIRHSVNLPKTEELIFYDNRVSPFRLSGQELRETYHVFSEFVEAVKLG